MYTLALHAAAAREECSMEALYAIPFGALNFTTTEYVCSMPHRYTQDHAGYGCLRTGCRLLLAGCFSKPCTDTDTSH